MSDNVWVFAGAMVTSALAPAFMVWVTSRARKSEAAQTWARQDKVEARQEETVLRLAAETRSRLRQIHTLVNSSLTDALRRERDATEALLTSMREVATLRMKAGERLSPEAQQALDDLGERSVRMSRELDSRLAQTDVADKQREADVRREEGP